MSPREVGEQVLREPSGDAGVVVGALVAWSAIGLGATLRQGTYSPAAVVLVTVGTVVLALAAAKASRVGSIGERVVRATVALALLTALVVALVDPAPSYGTGAWAPASRDLTFAATGLVSLWYVARFARPVVGAFGAIALQAAAGVAMIQSSPRPVNDDWFMMQAATKGLSHGQNIYSVPWVGPPGQSKNIFAYLPGSAVLSWPFHVLFGDVRYGILAGLVVTCVLLVWVGRRSPFALLGTLPLLYPRSLLGLELSWIDPFVLMGVCAAAVATLKGRKGWAVVFLAVALTCKQQAWLVLPVAMAWKEFGWRRGLISGALAGFFVLPWALTDFHRFFYDVFQYQLHLPALLSSLSLFTTADVAGLHPVLAWLVVATVAAFLLALWHRVRGMGGLLLGAALVMSAFNLMNKQSFFNEWELAAGLAGAAAVFSSSRAHESLDRPRQAMAVGAQGASGSVPRT